MYGKLNLYLLSFVFWLKNRCRSLLQLDSKGRTLLTYAIRRNALQCIEV